jgi:hypothetical protein
MFDSDIPGEMKRQVWLRLVQRGGERFARLEFIAIYGFEAYPEAGKPAGRPKTYQREPMPGH